MKSVLFVCVENACRSQMAEGFARLLGKNLITAYSCGSKPSGQVNPKAIASMREIGYDLSTHQSRGLDSLPDIYFDFVFSMGCGDRCPTVRAKHRADWNIPDPKNMPPEEFAKIREQIRALVEELINEIRN